VKMDYFVKYLFFYSVDDSGRNVWAFSAGQYHRFAEISGTYRYIRSQDNLPLGAFGQCYGFNWGGFKNLEREALRHNLVLNFYDDAVSCDQGEVLEQHPAIIFGLSKPAGAIWLGNDIDRGTGDESKER
jgi:hypothetical protein